MFGDYLSDIIKALNFRYATKVFDPKRKVSDKDFDELLEVLRLAPSSFGLQAWKFIVIKDSKIREELMKVAWGQKQLVESSHLIALCAKNEVHEKDISHYIEFTAKERGIDLAHLKGFRDMLASSISSRPQNDLIEWNKKQTYIALGFLLEAAALKGIDTCPMEGFDAGAVDSILKLKEKGLTIATLCPIGYRSSEDKYATTKKIRFPKNQVIEVI